MLATLALDVAFRAWAGGELVPMIYCGVQLGLTVPARIGGNVSLLPLLNC